MDFFDLSGCNLIGLASSLAIFLSQELSVEEIGILAAFLTALGDNLAIIATTPLNSLNQKDSNLDSSKSET